MRRGTSTKSKGTLWERRGSYVFNLWTQKGSFWEGVKDGDLGQDISSRGAYMLNYMGVLANYSGVVFAIGQPALPYWGLVARDGGPTELANGPVARLAMHPGLGDILTPLLHGAWGGHRSPVLLQGASGYARRAASWDKWGCRISLMSLSPTFPSAFRVCS